MSAQTAPFWLQSGNAARRGDVDQIVGQQNVTARGHGDLSPHDAADPHAAVHVDHAAEIRIEGPVDGPEIVGHDIADEPAAQRGMNGPVGDGGGSRPGSVAGPPEPGAVVAGRRGVHHPAVGEPGIAAQIAAAAGQVERGPLVGQRARGVVVMGRRGGVGMRGRAS